MDNFTVFNFFCTSWPVKYSVHISLNIFVVVLWICEKLSEMCKPIKNGKNVFSVLQCKLFPFIQLQQIFLHFNQSGNGIQLDEYSTQCLSVFLHDYAFLYTFWMGCVNGFRLILISSSGFSEIQLDWKFFWFVKLPSLWPKLLCGIVELQSD